MSKETPAYPRQDPQSTKALPRPGASSPLGGGGCGGRSIPGGLEVLGGVVVVELSQGLVARRVREVDHAVAGRGCSGSGFGRLGFGPGFTSLHNAEAVVRRGFALVRRRLRGRHALRYQFHGRHSRGRARGHGHAHAGRYPRRGHRAPHRRQLNHAGVISRSRL